MCLIFAILIGCEEITENAKDHYNRGMFNWDLGEYDRAISDFTKALEIDQRYADAYYNRGLAYKYKGQYDKAITDYNKAIEINP
jgi:tetratricopeptide (TPR) repeat protein